MADHKTGVRAAVLAARQTRSTTAKHTPEPWHVTGSKKAQEATTTRCDLGVCASTGPVAVIDPNYAAGHSPGENAANARLIAAAPDLLAALRDLTSMHARRHVTPGANAPREVLVYEDRTGAMERARAAIAKAEGK